MRVLLLFVLIAKTFCCDRVLFDSMSSYLQSRTSPPIEYVNNLKMALAKAAEDLGWNRFQTCTFSVLDEPSQKSASRIFQFHQLFEVESIQLVDRLVRELKSPKQSGFWIKEDTHPLGQVYLKWVEANQNYNQFLDIQVATFSCTPLAGTNECFQVDMFRSQPKSLVERKYFNERLLWDVSHIPDGSYHLRLRWRTGQFLSPNFNIAHSK